MQITLLLLSGLFISVLFGMVIIPRILVISHKKRLIVEIPQEQKTEKLPGVRLMSLLEKHLPAILDREVGDFPMPT